MLKQMKKYLLSGLLGIFLSYPMSLLAANMNISDVPLAVVSSVPPNVMLLLDNSGSMENIVWYQGDSSTISAYSSSATYNSWCGGCGVNNRWNIAQDFMTLSSINGGNPEGNCGTQNLSPITIPNPANPGAPYLVERFRVEGDDGNGNTKCLILPDILRNGGTRYTGHYLNYLFQNFNDGDDLTTIIPFKTRMMVMQEVASTLVENTNGMRFGLTTFDNGNGGRVLVGSRPADSLITSNNNATVSTSIGSLTAGGSTPLAESMYEITRYFRNLTPRYGSNDDFDDPVQYSCQKNFVIAVTDGLPTDDTTFNTSGDTDISTYCPQGIGNCSIPDWDDLGNAGLTIGTETHFADAGNLFFDDLVKFGYDLDVKRGAGFDTPPYDRQNIETYVVGFSIANILLRDAAHYGSGLTSSDPERDRFNPDTHYFTANDEEQLRQNLETALTSIEGQSGSAASVAASTGFVGAGTSLFQGLYDTRTWTGNLKWHELILNPDATVSIDLYPNPPNPDAATVLTAMITDGVPRNIYSFNPELNNNNGGGIRFDWAFISPTQKSLLDDRQEILEYLQGSQDCETTSAGACSSPRVKNLRDRNTDGEGFLGTIVNSSPIYIGRPIAYFPNTWAGLTAPENDPGAQTYNDFKTYHENRRGIVYVGANDGMLHAFDGGHVGNPYDVSGDPSVDPTMREIFAYVPGAVYRNLADFSNSAHQHRYYVDGTPNVIDAFFGDSGGDQRWHTVLVGGLNNGGQGIYALDVTNPDTFGSRNVLWEFTDDNDRDLGYTFSRPAVVRMHNGEWAAVFGNGYNNTVIDDGDTNGDGIVDSNDDTGNNDSLTGTAVLYIVNIRTGDLIAKIDTGVGPAGDPAKTPNGMSTLGPVDVDNDFIVDFIYGGDLYGNLWRFDVTGSSPGAWRILGKGNGASSQGPIFTAVDSLGNPQPITTRPVGTITSAGGLMLYFGTGQYLQVTDISDYSVQTFYGLLDNPIADKRPGNTSTRVTRADMVRQYITAETSFGNEAVRQFSRQAPDNYVNWYLDLISPANPGPIGERVIGPAIVRGLHKKSVIFTSIIPTEDVCDYGGRSWLIELDARNGNQTRNPVFDLNFDGVLDNLDNSGSVVNNGWMQRGIQTTPAILSGTDSEYKILSGSTGTLRAIGEKKLIKNGERQSWRQIK